MKKSVHWKKKWIKKDVTVEKQYVNKTGITVTKTSNISVGVKGYRHYIFLRRNAIFVAFQKKVLVQKLWKI